MHCIRGDFFLGSTHLVQRLTWPVEQNCLSRPELLIKYTFELSLLRRQPSFVLYLGFGLPALKKKTRRGSRPSRGLLDRKPKVKNPAEEASLNLA